MRRWLQLEDVTSVRAEHCANHYATTVATEDRIVSDV
jgi:hypothetical protein